MNKRDNITVNFEMPLDYGHDGTTSEILVTGTAEVRFGYAYYDEDLKERFEEEDEATVTALCFAGCSLDISYMHSDALRLAEKKAIKVACAKLDADTMQEFIAQFQAQPTH